MLNMYLPIAGVHISLLLLVGLGLRRRRAGRLPGHGRRLDHHAGAEHLRPADAVRHRHGAGQHRGPERAGQRQAPQDGQRRLRAGRQHSASRWCSAWRAGREAGAPPGHRWAWRPAWCATSTSCSSPRSASPCCRSTCRRRAEGVGRREGPQSAGAARAGLAIRHPAGAAGAAAAHERRGGLRSGCWCSAAWGSASWRASWATAAAGRWCRCFVYVLGTPTYVAVGTSLVCVMVSGAYGTFTYALQGRVEIFAALCMMAGAASARSWAARPSATCAARGCGCSTPRCCCWWRAAW